ncbi:MAG: hypothetical protein K2N80_15055, partial [Lachnospiraceae bacterium]|nr:hypothetical protein [Lachnospiraceae bacterium]
SKIFQPQVCACAQTRRLREGMVIRLKNQRFFIDEFIRLANIVAKTLSASAQISQVVGKA